MKVTHWESRAGVVSRPIIADDRDKYPASHVNDVLAFLERERPKWEQQRKATPQILDLNEGTPSGFVDPEKGRVQVPEKVGTVTGKRPVEWRTGLAGIPYRPQGVYVAEFQVLIAMETFSGHIIAGPLIRVEQHAQIQ